MVLDKVIKLSRAPDPDAAVDRKLYYEPIQQIWPSPADQCNEREKNKQPSHRPTIKILTSNFQTALRYCTARPNMQIVITSHCGSIYSFIILWMHQ